MARDLDPYSAGPDEETCPVCGDWAECDCEGDGPDPDYDDDDRGGYAGPWDFRYSDDTGKMEPVDRY